MNKNQHRTLMACLSESRHIYNGMLERVKAQYAETGTFPSKYDLEAAFKGQSVRTHICTSCGYIADRDVNAAKNILVAGQGMAIRERLENAMN